jgi:hypothetical protein
VPIAISDLLISDFLICPRRFTPACRTGRQRSLRGGDAKENTIPLLHFIVPSIFVPNLRDLGFGFYLVLVFWFLVL